MEIRWLGHSAFEIISDDNVKILIDPFISNNPACQVPVEDLNPDIILLTHGHSDHFGDALEISNNTNAPIACIHEISLFLAKQGIRNISINIGGSFIFRNIKFTMLEAKHSSDIDIMDETVPGGTAASFLITFEDGTKIFHAGDTGLFGDMKTIIGDASMWLNPKAVIPMHYNTFPPIEQDPAIFANFVSQFNPNIDVVVMNPDEYYEYNPEDYQD